MEWIWDSVNHPVSFLVLVVFVVRVIKAWSGSCKKIRRPPGPAGWPIFGNVFQLGDLPHQTMHKLKLKYGPLLWLQLGSINTMVVQNAEAAAQLFKKHDVSFCDRKPPYTLTALDFDKGALAFTNYGGYWRVLRRICSTEFLVNKRMSETVQLRRRMIDNMVRWIEDDSAASRARGGSGAVQISRFLFLMTFNVVGNLMLSRDLLDPNDPEGAEFFESMHEISEIAGTPNIADFFPFLKWIDPLGLRRRMVNKMTQTMRISSKFVQERLKKRKAREFQEKKDFLDLLLEYEGDGRDRPARFTEKHVNIIIMEMCMAGTDTSVSSIEWSLTELLSNPHTLEKLRQEIDQVVGLNRKVEESDIENLPYLQAVVKESLRLHPAVPLLFPRKTVEDTNYMGYLIPKGTQVLVNAWAIGRDPESWEDPLTFKPERFLNSSVEYKGQHFELIPFGSGRRICVGLLLAHRLLHLALATLVQAFDWDLGAGAEPQGIDMDEKLGLVLKKKILLEVIPQKRLHV